MGQPLFWLDLRREERSLSPCQRVHLDWPAA